MLFFMLFGLFIWFFFDRPDLVFTMFLDRFLLLYFFWLMFVALALALVLYHCLFSFRLDDGFSRFVVGFDFGLFLNLDLLLTMRRIFKHGPVFLFLDNRLVLSWFVLNLGLFVDLNVFIAGVFVRVLDDSLIVAFIPDHNLAI